MTDLSPDDLEFLEHAARLSLEGCENRAGGPFGAVIVKDGAVIAEGWNQVTSGNDPTAHAEIVAIRNACAALETFDLSGATIYSSCEPCPMCLGAVYWARLDRLIYANTRDQAAAIGFDDAVIYDEIPKPPSGRTLPTLQVDNQTAQEAFALWDRMADKVAY